MINKYVTLSPETTFHIYNRANGNEKLFISAENYRYFIQKYQEHILPIADTFCYCLMPNHFHFLVRIKTEDQLRTAFPKLETLKSFQAKASQTYLALICRHLINSKVAWAAFL